MYRPTDRLRLFASLHVSLGYIKIKLKYKVFDQHIFFPIITATSEAVRVSHLRFMNFQVIQVSVGAQLFPVIWPKYNYYKRFSP